jgi:ectoine hydroxylase-related dioxygenase (phytanoyl-CoA dioxygenase family)
MVMEQGGSAASPSRRIEFEQLSPSDLSAETPRSLDALLEEQGYLYFRGVFDAHDVAETRAEIIDVLAKNGLVKPGSKESTWSGRDHVAGSTGGSINDTLSIELNKARVWERFTERPKVRAVFERIWGEPAFFLPVGVYRLAIPERDESKPQLAFPHQDHHFIAGIPFRTTWIPLMDIDESLGGLALVPRKHTLEALNDPASRRVIKGKKYEIPPEKIPDGVWHRADYKVGDLVLMHWGTPHSGIINRSDRVRLSMDLRMLRQSDPRPAIGVIEKIEADWFLLKEDDGNEQRFLIDSTTFMRSLASAKGELKQDFADQIRLADIIPVGTRAMVVSSGQVAKVVRPTTG